jgi:hypothetical protein
MPRCCTPVASAVRVDGSGGWRAPTNAGGDAPPSFDEHYRGCLGVAARGRRRSMVRSAVPCIELIRIALG